MKIEESVFSLEGLEERIFNDENYDTDRYYDEVDIKDFEYDKENEVFTYPCPCGDRFEISVNDIFSGEEIAMCPSCPLITKVVYEEDDMGWIKKMVGH